MFLSHHAYRDFFIQHLPELMNWVVLDGEYTIPGGRVDILAVDGSSLIAIDIKLSVKKCDIQQVERYKRQLSAEHPEADIRVAIFALSYENIFRVSEDIELYQYMVALDFDIDDGIPRYYIQAMSIAPYSPRTHRIDTRFLWSMDPKPKSQLRNNPLLKRYLK